MQHANSALSQIQRIEARKMGRTVVANQRTGIDTRLINWATEQGLLVRVDRPSRSKWGNPYIMRKDTSIERERVIFEYRSWIQKQDELLADIDSLKGRVLGCWCVEKPCHGEILAALANGEPLPYAQPKYDGPKQANLF